MKQEGLCILRFLPNGNGRFQAQRHGPVPVELYLHLTDPKPGNPQITEVFSQLDKVTRRG
jgi:hypothetical protein